MPAVEEFNINETAAGGNKVTSHDGNIYEVNGKYVEEYAPDDYNS